MYMRAAGSIEQGFMPPSYNGKIAKKKLFYGFLSRKVCICMYVSVYFRNIQSAKIKTARIALPHFFKYTYKTFDLMHRQLLQKWMWSLVLV